MKISVDTVVGPCNIWAWALAFLIAFLGALVIAGKIPGKK
jgi:hypothetical protein